MVFPLQLLLAQRVMFGVPVVVKVYSGSQGQGKIAEITVPSLEEGNFAHQNRHAQLMTIQLSFCALLSLLVCFKDPEGTVKGCDGKTNIRVLRSVFQAAPESGDGEL